MNRYTITTLTALAFSLCTTAFAAPIDGVSFADSDGTLYAPARTLATELNAPIHWDDKSETLYFAGHKVPAKALRSLFDGTQVIAVRDLAGVSDKLTVSYDDTSDMATVAYRDRSAQVRFGAKKVIVNLDEQRMRAYQGDLVVLDTRVSTGRRGHRTPTGDFNAGPIKARMLISRSYNDAEMPYSVQIRGDYVIHGYPSVPKYAASHGCVRVPLDGGNPAQWFYKWVDVGVPVVIADSWESSPAANAKAEANTETR